MDFRTEEELVEPFRILDGLYEQGRVLLVQENFVKGTVYGYGDVLRFSKIYNGFDGVCPFGQVMELLAHPFDHALRPDSQRHTVPEAQGPAFGHDLAGNVPAEPPVTAVPAPGGGHKVAQARDVQHALAADVDRLGQP